MRIKGSRPMMYIIKDDAVLWVGSLCEEPQPECIDVLLDNLDLDYYNYTGDVVKDITNGIINATLHYGGCDDIALVVVVIRNKRMRIRVVGWWDILK